VGACVKLQWRGEGALEADHDQEKVLVEIMKLFRCEIAKCDAVHFEQLQAIVH
jgi:hypothetical protein